MVAHFPFVVVSILATACFQNAVLQRELGLMFNNLVSSRLVEGKFATLELLQALLVVLACIITDLRLDRSRSTRFWEVNKDAEAPVQDWGPDEIRALAGAYYLASSSSILMQKYRSLSYKPYILQACRHLEDQKLESSDKFLPLIVSLQNIIEKLDDLFIHSGGPGNLSRSSADLEQLRSEVSRIKRSINFPINESRTTLLQIHVTELLLNQSVSRSSLFGLEDLQAGQQSPLDSATFVPWLTENMMATQSIIDIYLSLPPGEEVTVSNLEWIALYCGLSLATRLDIVAAQPQMQFATKQLRRLCDVSLTLRQVILRLQSASSRYRSSDDCRHALHHLGLRACRLEAWYLRHLPPEMESNHSFTNSEIQTPTSDMEGRSNTSSRAATVPGHASFDAIDDGAISEMLSQIGSDANFGNFFFTMPGLDEDAYI
ncbi:hypothetical protein NLG97_g6994 [Lecanicillium saksenae]|uniref:Uncharacterized protein n=1 Tax=Lecanicillium saksenae TaxID=468837 RepID=A0ACC1QN23_9HYPO|nr:hypothetical protein NLG97_g6994 [Lecanicillium saksenae]